MKKYIFLIFGVIFGFLLSRAGATTYDFYAQLFLFQDLQLMKVIAAAAGVGMVGIAIMKKLKTRSLMENSTIDFSGKPNKPELIPGALIMGMGWGLAGACPGTALVMLGEGKLGALFTIFGVLVGTLIHGLKQNRQLLREGTATDLAGE
ncbi:MAG: YeeE/YedE family protein [Calditrichaeota bacterium]|nr:YeeE/YedE family protein [Calditrichota bacterium]MCB0295976.1 YeeE/YedE family protein [Calditrichota bacterium]MCB0302504.1 YeeE/YedE family protein [Calditrichota bacterium]MCB9087846.1 YeeE/YedE family protein [Calditrichia bacterium]